MNNATIIFLIICVISIITISFDGLILMCRWASIKKGKTAPKPFIEKGHRMALWSSLVIGYLAFISLCIFYDADFMMKAKIFAIIAILIPVHPLGIILIVEYCFLFHKNREYSKIQNIMGQGPDKGDNTGDSYGARDSSRLHRESSN